MIGRSDFIELMPLTLWTVEGQGSLVQLELASKQCQAMPRDAFANNGKGCASVRSFCAIACYVAFCKQMTAANVMHHLVQECLLTLIRWDS